MPCRFTNFIAKTASATAKFWFVRPIGKIPNVRIAARKICRKNSLRSRRQAQEQVQRLVELVSPHPAATVADIVAAAVAIAIDF